MKILISIILFLSSSLTYACKCAVVPEEEMFLNAEEVLFVEIQTTEYIEAEEAQNSKINATFKVLESFKIKKNSVNYITEDLSNCSPYFMAGRAYILYINKERSVSRCSGSRRLSPWSNPGKQKLELLRKQ